MLFFIGSLSTCSLCALSANGLRELTASDLKELGFKMGDRKRVVKNLVCC